MVGKVLSLELPNFNCRSSALKSTLQLKEVSKIAELAEGMSFEQI
jgi:pseudouridine-5'-phosphate glycosidase